MCLDSIEVTKPTPEGVGYKVFDKGGHLLRGEIIMGVRKTRTWLVAQSPFGSPFGYPLGFHIFTDLEIAKRWAFGNEVVRKVKYRKAHTRGFQGGRAVIVANEIYIYPGEVR